MQPQLNRRHSEQEPQLLKKERTKGKHRTREKKEGRTKGKKEGLEGHTSRKSKNKKE